MRAAFAPLAIVAGLAALTLVLLDHDEGFTMPDNFPVLEPADGGAEPAADAKLTDTEVATFGSGCFWCSEAVFEQIKGVRKVESGFSGGHVKNPTYRQVCSGRTGHAEVVQVTFDPKVIRYAELLEVFWRSHDPTTKDRQGYDRGPEYRSIVLYHSERQKQLAERYKQKIDEAAVFRNPVVTEIVAFEEFYPAGDEHQDYYANNPRKGYCYTVIGPKLAKLKKVFRDKLKPE